jgi:hypothetical protein
MSPWLSPERVERTLEALVQPALGVRYVWSGGGANARYPEGGLGHILQPRQRGWDCSGFTLGLLALLGALPWEWSTPRTSTGLRELCEPLAPGQQRPGDLAFYPGHVAVIATFPEQDGDSVIVEAGGGRSSTNGDDPRAVVRLRPGLREGRTDLVGLGRMHPIGVSALQAATVQAVHALANGAAPGALPVEVIDQLHGRYRGMPAVAAHLRQLSGGAHAG